MKNISLTILFFIAIIYSVSSQNRDDALRYSILDQGGSARVIGAGGAFGAMGGDIGVIGSNVSGLADFRKNEVALSVSYNNPKTTSSYLGNPVGSSNDGRNFNIDNIAYVKHTAPEYGSFVTSNFMIGFQQYASFGETYSYDAVNVGSLVEILADNVNFGDYSPFDDQLADETGAIYYDEELDIYLHDFSEITMVGDSAFVDNSIQEQIQKEEVIERSGDIKEVQIGWAGRTRGGLRLGLAIGIPWVSYEENKFYEENSTDGDALGFNKLNFNQSLTTSGIGFNIKAGVGYSIARKVRLGLNVQSPTFYRLDDLWYNSMLYDCSECIQPFQLAESGTGSFGYKLRTPFRLTGSVGTLMGKNKLKGFLNLDVHYIDYASNRFNFTYNSDLPEDAAYEQQQNFILSDELASGLSFNLGAEMAYDKYRLRAGVASNLKPFKNEIGQDYTLAAGLGYRAERFYLDMAFQSYMREEGYTPYLAETEDRDLFINNEVTRNRFVFTLGFKI